MDDAWTIRPAAAADAPAIATIYAGYVRGSVATFEEEPAPEDAEFVRRMAAAPALPWLLAEQDGVVLGYAYASGHRTRAAYRWATDVSVYLAPEARRRGIGTALYEALLPLVLDLGYVTAHAGITLPNPASVALHESLGFRLIGVYPGVGYKHGGWYDVGWWQRRLVDMLPEVPREPRAWDPGVA